MQKEYFMDERFVCDKCVQLTRQCRDPLIEECQLCPHLKGSFISYNGSLEHWVHILCALYMPGISIRKSEGDFQTALVSDLSKQNQRTCSLCGIDKGTTVRCVREDCKNFMHATCALMKKCKLLFKSKQILCARHSQRPAEIIRIGVKRARPKRSVFQSERTVPSLQRQRLKRNDDGVSDEKTNESKPDEAYSSKG